MLEDGSLIHSLAEVSPLRMSARYLCVYPLLQSFSNANLVKGTRLFYDGFTDNANNWVSWTSVLSNTAETH